MFNLVGDVNGCLGFLRWRYVDFFWARFQLPGLTTAASSPTPAHEDCARLRLERFSSVGRAPTSATEPSVLEYGTICQLISDSRTCVIQPFQTVGENVLIWSVGPKRSVNLLLTALYNPLRLLGAGFSKHGLRLTTRLTREIPVVNSWRVFPRQNPRVYYLVNSPS